MAMLRWPFEGRHPRCSPRALPSTHSLHHDLNGRCDTLCSSTSAAEGICGDGAIFIGSTSSFGSLPISISSSFSPMPSTASAGAIGMSPICPRSVMVQLPQSRSGLTGANVARAGFAKPMRGLPACQNPQRAWQLGHWVKASCSTPPRRARPHAGTWPPPCSSS